MPAVHCPQCNQEYTPPILDRSPFALAKVNWSEWEKVFQIMPGDWTICPGCAFILIIGENLAPRVPSEDEWTNVMNDMELFSRLKSRQRHALELIRRENLIQ